MELDPALTDLRRELDELGFVVVPHGDHICIRLSMLASVRVRLERGALRLQPQFGPLARSKALVLGLLGAPAAVAAAFAAIGLAPLSLAAAAGAGAYLLSDIYRLVLTEGCVTRLQLLWAGRAPARSVPAGSTPPELAARCDTALLGAAAPGYLLSGS